MKNLKYIIAGIIILAIAYYIYTKKYDNFDCGSYCNQICGSSTIGMCNNCISNCNNIYYPPTPDPINSNIPIRYHPNIPLVPPYH